MNREAYEHALAEVTHAARVYHGGITDQAAGDSSSTVWSPIYADLLTELASQLRTAGARYDQTADEVGVAATDRFDWSSYLSEG